MTFDQRGLQGFVLHWEELKCHPRSFDAPAMAMSCIGMLLDSQNSSSDALIFVQGGYTNQLCICSAGLYLRKETPFYLWILSNCWTGHEGYPFSSHMA